MWKGDTYSEIEGVVERVCLLEKQTFLVLGERGQLSGWFHFLGRLNEDLLVVHHLQVPTGSRRIEKDGEKHQS